MIIYVGPTILGIAARNTVFETIPESLSSNFESYPCLRNLCVSLDQLSEALMQIRTKEGAFYTFFKTASQIVQ